ncbi:MAG: hypothetical protein NTY23_08985 [Chloroflexi bacterium]|nr:hypothetical protein [Chloroflexota bacterium]
MESVLAIAGLVLVLLGSVAVFLLRTWRWALAAFAVQSLGMGLVALTIVALPIALAETLTGWLVAGILALTLRREGMGTAEVSIIPPGWLFRALLALMILVTALALLPDLRGALNDPPGPVTLAAVVLMAFGVLGLGLNEQPLRVGVALITTLQGFELAYLWSERSLLVIALLAAVHLTIVLSVIYLNAVTRRSLEEEVRA